ncbi:MAG: hypothetical protein JSV04_02555 [Candidatus Heimdallarchaeota archaeon]|nr:MAG: hypothetical protein JSV04_02555 [Candidatus Heimdallarchaeota archaeon]
MVKLSESEKLILLYLYIRDKPITAGHLFQVLSDDYGFSRTRQSLHSMVKKLKKNAYISWEPHRLVELTNKGKKYAEHLHVHRHLLEEYFKKTLDNLSDESVRNEALRLTPIVSCDFIEAIDSSEFHEDDCTCGLRERQEKS